MMIEKIMLSIALCFACQTGHSAPHCAPPDSQVFDAIVRIASGDGSNGSGVIIAKNHVLTAAHVLSETNTLFIGYDGTFKEARLILIDEENDLALLEAPTANLHPLPIAIQELLVNDKIWALGYPRATVLTVTPGVLENSDGSTLHTSAEIDLGDSGGGLVGCQQGKHVLAGMLRGYGAIKRGEEYIKIEHYSASVAARDIIKFIQTSNTLVVNQRVLSH